MEGNTNAFFVMLIDSYKIMICKRLHAILYHCDSTLSMNLVWAWQDLTTAECVLKINVPNVH